MQTEVLRSNVVAFVVDVSRTRWTADDRVQCERLSFILDCLRSSVLLHGHLTHGQPFSVYHIDVLGCVHRLINAVADGGAAAVHSARATDLSPQSQCAGGAVRLRAPPASPS